MAIEPADPVRGSAEPPPELVQRATELADLRRAQHSCKSILAKLQPLSDKRASVLRIDGRLKYGTQLDRLRTRATQPSPVKSTAYADSALPEGMSFKISGDHAPSKNRSLYHHYLWRMKRAIASQNVYELNILVGDATRDYLEHIGERHAPHFEHHGDAVEHLLTHYTGVPADRAAIDMRTPNQSFRQALQWVHRQRVQNHCDPELGEPRENDERTQRIFNLAEQGIKQSVIADELGVSQQRVSQILAGRS